MVDSPRPPTPPPPHPPPHLSGDLTCAVQALSDDAMRCVCDPQDLVQGFFRDIFNFQEVRFTTVEDLAEDILIKAKEASERAWERLAPDQALGAQSEH